MREVTTTTKLYPFDELSERAKERARDWWKQSETFEYLLDEGLGSLKGLFKAAGISLTDLSIGAYNRDNRVSFDMGDAGELKGARVVAWLENNLFGPLRLTRADVVKLWKNYKIRGEEYGVGAVKPCPFTGVCYDDDLIYALCDATKKGETLKDAFKSLAGVLGRILEADISYQSENEQVDDAIMANDYEFMEDGKRA